MNTNIFPEQENSSTETEELPSLPTLPLPSEQLYCSNQSNLRLPTLLLPFEQLYCNNHPNLRLPTISADIVISSYIEHEPFVMLDIHLFDANHSYDNCTICISEYKVEEKIVKLKCKHYFHYACIMAWLKEKNTCPICRSKVH